MGSLSPAADLAQRLAQNAENVCRHYLSNGRRQGGYWLVGDVANQPGRSLFVRLRGPDHGKGAAGKWTDAGVSAIAPADAWTAVLDGRSFLDLQDGLHVRRARVMGEHRVELCDFTDGMVDRLKALGLISEIISWKLRLFIPTSI